MIRIQRVRMAGESLQSGPSHRHPTSPDAGMDPRTIIQGIEQHALLPPGTADRFAGYAVIGLPFRSGHVLSLRRFPASPWGRDTLRCGIAIPRGAGRSTRP